VAAVSAAQVRGAAAAVGDLAAERAVQDHPDLDGRLSVADGVGEQLADNQLGREGDLLESPAGQLAGDPAADVGDDRRLGGQVPGDDPVGGQGPGAGDKQGRVILGSLRKQGVDQAVADGFQRRCGVRRAVGREADVGQYLAHRGQPGVDVALPGFDQAVGVQDEQAALGQLDLGFLEGQPAQAQRRARGKVEEPGRAVGVDDGRRRVAGPGQRAAAGHRIVDRVQARSGQVGGSVAALGQALLVSQARDDVIEPGEQLARFEVDIRQRPDGGAQPAHGGGRVDAVAGHVADDQRDPAPRQPPTATWDPAGR
jgi:hypothetical protein